MNEHNQVREMMVFGQIMPNKVNDETIVNALNSVPKEYFVPKAMRGVAYVDQRISISENRFVMEPMTLARLMLAADISKNHLVLVVGAGSGYEAAVIGQCADAVVALEEDANLVERSTKNLMESGADNVAVVEGKLVDGVKGQGPFDIIFINGAVEEMPQSLVEQLSDGGRIVCIMIDEGVAHCHMIEKHGKEMICQNLFEAEASILPGFEMEKTFVFP